MNVLFATSIKFPSPLANRMQVNEMANAFYDTLGASQFYFGGRNLPTNIGKREMRLCRIAGRKKSYLFAYRYLQRMKKLNTTVVFCREEKLFFFLLLFNRIFFRLSVKMVFEAHFVPKRFSFLWRYLLKHADLIVCTSSVVAEAFKIYRKLPTMVFLHGVALGAFSGDVSMSDARKQLDISQDIYLLGYTGSLHTMGSVNKGMYTVLEAMTKVPGVHLIAVGGDVDDINTYKQYAELLDLKDRAQFVERVDRKALFLYQKAVNALLLPMPANEYRTMLPLKVFEYMASERPIIASRLPSVRDILSKENAFLFLPGDAEALAAAITYVRNNPDQAKKKSVLAYKQVADYTWEKRAVGIIEAIKSL